MRYHVVLNAEAGPDGKAHPGGSPDEVRQAFAAAGIGCDLEVVPPQRIDEAVRAAATTRPDAVVVGGGDGTIRSAAGILVDTGIALGVLPLGTFNHFAKDLGLPVSVPEAIAALASASPRAIDVGDVNGHVFVNNCSIGAYAEAVRRRDALRDLRGWGKKWAMFRASCATFRRLKRLRLEVRVEANHQAPARPPRSIRTPLLAVANNRYTGQVLDECLRDRLDAGELWLYTVHAHRHLAVLRLMLQALVRRLDDTDALEAEAVSSVVVTCAQADVPIAADGELVPLRSPFHFRVRPRALRVLAPLATRESGTERPGTGRSTLQSSLASDPIRVSGFRFPPSPS